MQGIPVVNGNHRLAAALEEPYQLLMEAVEEYAIFVLDPGGTVTTWNAGARRIKGYSEAEIVGRNYSVFFIDDDVLDGKPQRLLADATADGHAVDEGWRVRKDGSRFWANIVITALYDNDDLYGFAKITRDDTERRAAAHHQREMEVLLDHDRIARDLNEAVITRIFRAGLALEGLRNLSQPHHHEHIDQAVHELDLAIQEMRAIVLDL
jgi:PAS domain S-box-containing protein